MNDKRIIITSGLKKAYHPDCKKITEKKLYSVLAGMINGNDSANFVLLTASPDKIMEDLKKRLTYIEAGGGLVRNEQGQYLFIFRHGKWDLPKGKLEPGETPPEGSLREVEEECSITVKRITEPLTPTWHAYALNGNITLKQTFWYRMEAGDYRQMKPQLAEGITEVKWFSADELDEVRKNTYDLIREVIGDHLVEV